MTVRPVIRFEDPDGRGAYSGRAASVAYSAPETADCPRPLAEDDGIPYDALGPKVYFGFSDIEQAEAWFPRETWRGFSQLETPPRVFLVPPGLVVEGGHQVVFPRDKAVRCGPVWWAP